MRIFHTPNLVRQLYALQDLEVFMSFPVYLVLDFCVHVVSTVLCFVFWQRYISITSTVVAFVFHRSWSVVNSGGKSIYLPGDSVYKNKDLPWWGWPVIYTGESTVLILATIASFAIRSEIVFY